MKKKQTEKPKKVHVSESKAVQYPTMKPKPKILRRKRPRPPNFVDLDLEEDEDSSDGLEIEGTKTIRSARVENGYLDLRGESEDSEDEWYELESDDPDDLSDDSVIYQQPPKKRQKLQDDSNKLFAFDK